MRQPLLLKPNVGKHEVIAERKATMAEFSGRLVMVLCTAALVPRGICNAPAPFSMRINLLGKQSDSQCYSVTVSVCVCVCVCVCVFPTSEGRPCSPIGYSRA